MTIPITTIGGYLGSGKTTLVNHLLANAEGRQFTVLVNDFGDINIDAELISAQNADTIALTNGCVCCSVSDSLTETLAALAERQPPPEHIVIEASGVALPDKVARVGDGWASLKHHKSIVLIDASTICHKSKDKYVGRLVQDQIAQGDLLILNKTDAANPAALADAIDLVRSINSSAAQCETVNAVLPMTSFLTSAEVGDHNLASAPKSNFWTFSVKIGPVDREKFEEAFATFSTRCERAKGIVTYADDASRQRLQWAGGKKTCDQELGSEATTTLGTELMFIGTGTIDQEHWKKRFQACVSHIDL